MKIRAPLPGSKIDNLRNTIEKQVGIILTKKGFLRLLVLIFPFDKFQLEMKRLKEQKEQEIEDVEIEDSFSID